MIDPASQSAEGTSTPAQPALKSDCCVWCGLPVAINRNRRSLLVGNSEDFSRASLYCCYGCRVAHAITQEKGIEGQVRWTVVRLGLSIFFTMNLMAFTMTMWSLDVYDVQSTPFQQKLFEVFRWISMLFGLPVLLLLGVPLLQSAIESCRQRIWSTDLLIATGVTAAYLTSVINVLRGSSTVYFEVGAMVLVAVTLGRLLEAVGKQKATEALDQLTALLPLKACRRTTVGEQQIDSNQIQVGDQLRVRAGDRFATDGVLVSGRTTVDEQVFTGESTAVERVPGSVLLAGTVNLDGDVIVRVTAGFREGSFGRLLRLMQEARTTRGTYQLLADRISTWFFPSVTAISLLTFAVHAGSGLGVALQHSLSVLLIACPCALGLATPLAVWTALSTAISRQVLFRSGEAIERLASVQHVCMDKTGTLTTGSPHVLRLEYCNSPDAVPADLMINVICELATASRHPFSEAVSDYCRQEGLTIPSADAAIGSISSRPLLRSIRTVAGSGVEGVTSEGRTVRLGSIDFVSGRSLGNHLQESVLAATDHFPSSLLAEADREGLSLVAAGFDADIQTVFLLSETIRPETLETLRRLEELKISVTVLTGDRHARATRLCQELSVQHALDVRGELKPEDKVKTLAQIRDRGMRTVMVGDGINDAPALAASDVGIAMGCGADVSRDSAQICLLSNDLRRIPWAIRLARQTRRVIRQNLFWAFSYNSAGVVMASLGWLNPAVAAGLMIVSSLLVITNSLRLLVFETELDEATRLDETTNRQPLTTTWQPTMACATAVVDATVAQMELSGASSVSQVRKGIPR